MTEFAFRSDNTTDLARGNYLDGISFQSPAFLSISKFIRSAAGSTDVVSFTTPGTTLTVELRITSHGEIPAVGVVIKDQLEPFTDYIEYLGNVRIDGVSATGTFDGDTVSIPLPASYLPFRAGAPEITITFDIFVRDTVLGDIDTSTDFYYFRNQGVVEFYSDYKEYRRKELVNGSLTVRVDIDQIEMTKTVEPKNPLSSLVDGPFLVNMSIENISDAGALVTDGMIIDVLPPGFVYKTGSAEYRINRTGAWLPIEPHITGPDSSTNWTTRLSFWDVNLSATDIMLEYRYEMTYSGDHFGTSFIHVTSEYLYMRYTADADPINVTLPFPQNVVGLSAKAKPSFFEIEPEATAMLDFVPNSYLEDYILFDDDYEVFPAIVLMTDRFGTVAPGSPNQQIIHDDYTATLHRGTNMLQFDANANANGIYVLYYQIQLTAEKGGAESFVLNSPITTITIYVQGTDVLVYFEEYEKEEAGGTLTYSYGFSGINHSPIVSGLDDPLNPADALTIDRCGYGVLSNAPDQNIWLDGVEVTPLIDPIIEDVDGSGLNLYMLDVPVEGDYVLQGVAAGSTTNVLGYIHPNFARAVYETDDPIDTDETFYIRTGQQLLNIGLLLPPPVANPGINTQTFYQERDVEITESEYEDPINAFIEDILDNDNLFFTTYNATYLGNDFNIIINGVPHLVPTALIIDIDLDEDEEDLAIDDPEESNKCVCDDCDCVDCECDDCECVTCGSGTCTHSDCDCDDCDCECCICDDCDCEDCDCNGKVLGVSRLNPAITMVGAVFAGPAIAGAITGFYNRNLRRRRKMQGEFVVRYGTGPDGKRVRMLSRRRKK